MSVEQQPVEVVAGPAAQEGEAHPGGGVPRRRALVSLLTEAGVASEEELQLALAEGLGSGERLGEVVLRRGWLDEAGLARLLAAQWELPFLGEDELGAEAAPSLLVPLEEARRLGGCALQRGGETLLVVSEPATERFDDLAGHLDGEASFAVTTPRGLAGLLERLQALHDERETGQAAEAVAAAAGREDDAQAETIVAELEAASRALNALRGRVAHLQTARRQHADDLAAALAELAREQGARAQLEARLRALQADLDQHQERLVAAKQQLGGLAAALDG